MNEIMLTMLDDTIKFYSEDVRRRSTNGNGGCYYIAPNGNKCAIGRLLTEDEVKQWQGCRDFYSGAHMLFGTPKAFIGISKQFISDLQKLHDIEAHWLYNGLSELGKQWAESIRKAINNSNYE